MTDAAKAPEGSQRTLARLREAARLTQEQVAKSMGVGRPQVSRIEAQFPGVPFVSLLAYLKAIGAEDVVLSHPVLGEIPITDVVADPTRQQALERRRASRKKL